MLGVLRRWLQDQVVLVLEVISEVINWIPSSSREMGQTGAATKPGNQTPKTSRWPSGALAIYWKPHGRFLGGLCEFA